MQTIGSSADSSPHRTRPVRIFAHRGSSGLFAEHTRAAYLRALEEGAGAVADMTWRQMRRLDVHSWKTPRLPGRCGVDVTFMRF